MSHVGWKRKSSCSRYAPPDNQVQRFQGNPQKDTKWSEALLINVHHWASIELKWLMTVYHSKIDNLVLSANCADSKCTSQEVFGDASCLIGFFFPFNKQDAPRYYSRFVIPVVSCRCASVWSYSVAVAPLVCSRTAGCRTLCPSFLCSHATLSLQCQESRSTFAQTPVKMAGWSTKNNPPFFLQNKSGQPQSHSPHTTSSSSL